MSYDPRLAALRRFAVAISLLNLIGHLFLGFEQSWAQPLVAVAAAYATALLLEGLSAFSENRRPGFAGGPLAVVDFLLPAHITGLACAMLLYASDRLMPIVFAVVVALASKVLLRVAMGSCRRHFFNPSNLGITVTLLAFPWVGIAQPYMFTENLTGVGDWVLPGIIVVSGSFLNARLTRRMPMILAWATAFAAQAVIRGLLFDVSIVSGLAPVTGVAFLLFSFYMLTDPATTPVGRRAQIFFGVAVAGVYGVLMALHVVFGLFFALTMVSGVRGSYLLLTQGEGFRVLAAPPMEGAAALVRRS